MLSLDTAKRLLVALGSQTSGNEVASILNNSATGQGQAGWTTAAIIKAAHVSTTTDFGSLKVGDYVVHVGAAAGNAIFYTVATAGTLPAAAVVNDLYVVFRQLTLPAASALTL